MAGQDLRCNKERITATVIATIKWKRRGNESPPLLLGDFNQWEPEEGKVMSDLSETIYWEYDVQSDARLEYCFFDPDRDIVFPDPDNTFQVLNGLGSMSELVMPEYKYDVVFEPFRAGKKSSFEDLEKISMQSIHLGYAKDFCLYRTKSEKSDPRAFLVFQDGFDYVEFAHTVHILRYLEDTGQIPPCDAAFVNPPNRHVDGEPNRISEYGLNPNYSAFLATELVPKYSRSKLNVCIGASFGGLCAIYTALKHPDVFLKAYSQSGYVGYRRDHVLNMLLESDPIIEIYADIGVWERKVGSSFLDPQELDFLSANRRLRQILVEKGYKHLYSEHSEGHTWGFWRAGLVRYLPEILKGDKP
jgi:enterochelin esterase-like enzyme